MIEDPDPVSDRLAGRVLLLLVSLSWLVLAVVLWSLARCWQG